MTKFDSISHNDYNELDTVVNYNNTLTNINRSLEQLKTIDISNINNIFLKKKINKLVESLEISNKLASELHTFINEATLVNNY